MNAFFLDESERSRAVKGTSPPPLMMRVLRVCCVCVHSDGRGDENQTLKRRHGTNAVSAAIFTREGGEEGRDDRERTRGVLELLYFQKKKCVRGVPESTSARLHR
jgi:hypothetical protein